MRFGPRDKPHPDEEPDDPPPPAAQQGDVHVAGRKPEPDQEAGDWVPIQTSETDSSVVEQAATPRPPDPPPAPESDWQSASAPGPGTPEPSTPTPENDWQSASETRPDVLSKDTAPVDSPPEPVRPATPGGRHKKPTPAADEPPRDLPAGGLSAEPPGGTDALWSKRAGLPAKGLAKEPPGGTVKEDDGQRKAQVDAFVAEFVGSATWQATLAVLEGAFPGLGMASTLSRRTDDVWRTIGALDRTGAKKLGLPVWADEAGMVFDLSAHLHVGNVRREVRPRASRPYAGAFVIDTLDPLRYHRAVGGPQGPGEGPREARVSEEDDTGVVIVADLTAAGVRVMDSVVLWRFAGRVVTSTLNDSLRPETRARARRALRALRRVVFVDPDLGLGVCLQIDATRTPRCLLAFGVDRTEVTAPRFVRI